MKPPRLTMMQMLPHIATVLLVAAIVPMSPRAHEAGLTTGSRDSATCLLPLPVPASSAIEFELQSTVRGPGLLITWPDLDPSVSTCTALLDTVGLGFRVEVSGHYTDTFDRLLRIEFTTPGSVGDTNKNDFICRWENAGADLSGRTGGFVNLSNTAGLWAREADGVWGQRNSGLPVHTRFTNLVDLAASSAGPHGQTLLAGVTSGFEVTTNPVGLFRSVHHSVDDVSWQWVRPDVFGRDTIITKVAISPLDPNHFAVGTLRSGVFVTTDGGATFTRWTDNLDVDFSSLSTQYPVTALFWTADPAPHTRLYVAVRYYGVFYASVQDNYASFTRLANLTIPNIDGVNSIPRVRSLAIDPSNPQRIVAGLTSEDGAPHNGVYVSSDGGQNWNYKHLQFQGLEGGVTNPNARKTPTSLYIYSDPPDGQRMVMGTENHGFWHTTDGGDVWYEMASPFMRPEAQPRIADFAFHDGTLVAQVLNQGLHAWSDSDNAWVALTSQPWNRRGTRVLSTGLGLLLAASQGGIFEPGSTFELSDSIAFGDHVELGLSLTFGPGRVDLQEDPTAPGTWLPRLFHVLAQNYQGWIVWRSDEGDPDKMEMIGRYDKLNPETCIEGYCGDDGYVIDVLCFSERKAACFNFERPGYISFYDDNIFNGFTYLYAVTPYDYGDISMLSSPTALSSPKVYPPRFTGDPYVVPRFEGDPLPQQEGNRRSIRIDAYAAPALDGKQVYVFPNPLRLGAGLRGFEGERVVWTNLPPDSKIQVFTLAGDHIADLPQPGEPQQGGNIYWATRNKDGQQLASGIYMWKLIMPQRGDYWGKLVIIR